MQLDNILQEFRKPFKDRKSTDLKKMLYLSGLLDNPQDNFLSIHIAGTNGKGSVSSMLNEVLIESGLKVGVFTSPHLERFTERIKINNNEITESDFLRILNENVLPILKLINTDIFDLPTEFEIITLVAFCYFSEQNVDISVIECGLGGRFDATNILKNVVLSVITNISQDHTDRLGSSIQEITNHKTGIIKHGVPVVTTTLNQEKDIFFREIENAGNQASDLYFADPLKIEVRNDSILTKHNVSYIYKDEKSIFCNKQFTSNFIASYQKENVVLTLKALDILFQKIYQIPQLKDLSKNSFTDICIKGLQKAKWAGRFEIFNFNGFNIILDGAHNDNGMKAFTDSLKELPIKKIITIFACNKDKDYQNMINYLAEISETIIVTKSHVEIKAKDPENIDEYLTSLNKDHKIVKDYRQTVDFACKIITDRNYNKKDVLICVCGSLYLIGAIREQINI